jgi:hypothetical protein
VALLRPHLVEEPKGLGQRLLLPPGRKFNKCDNIRRMTTMKILATMTTTTISMMTMIVAAIVNQENVVDEDDPAQCL